MSWLKISFVADVLAKQMGAGGMVRQVADWGHKYIEQSPHPRINPFYKHPLFSKECEQEYRKAPRETGVEIQSHPCGFCELNNETCDMVKSFRPRNLGYVYSSPHGFFYDQGSGDVRSMLRYAGDCITASQIYAMLMDYKGKIAVKVDGIAASAASVIAMAGTTVLMAPAVLMMVHNPLAVTLGDSEEMQKAISMLSEVKESIISAYEIKTGQSRAKLSHLMDAETWLNANKAIELCQARLAR